MAASSSSSSQVPWKKNDLFISFRGSDIRRGFLSHLTKELRRKGIDFYVDKRLESGEEISSALVKAIEASVISLVIFSKAYASSKWCLEELVKIMECQQVNQHIVIPVFYNIDPSDVRHQRGTYADAFTKHEEKFKDNMDKLQIWRSTLTDAANLSGYHNSSNFENESNLIDKISEDVLKKLEDKASIEPKRLVGSYENLASVESFMKIESQEVQILGIWGMGGIGKTTLARAAFGNFFSQYDSSYFVENVREESKGNNGLTCLLEKILSALLNEENLAAKGGHNMVAKSRLLRRKRVLLVLDDVDAPDQLQYLSGENLSLGPGSKVIITSRDRHVLIRGKVHALHEVKELNMGESLQLFCLQAFQQGHPKMGFEKLSAQAIEYARGLPLALKVLGSYLNCRDIKAWESALRKFRKYPIVEIQTVLRLSYDGLDETEKSIFLDIAFFFRGQQKDDVIRFLDACDFYAEYGIVNLVDKSLITISRDNRIEIHDLLQEMAEKIVREESPKDPGRRSRLNDAEEIQDVLQNNLGTDAIEGIILSPKDINKLLCWSHDTYKNLRNLRNLRFLGINCVETWGKKIYWPWDPKLFSKKLRYFEWKGYPFKSLPLGFCPEKLVEIHVQGSNVEKLWDGVQDLTNLRVINLHRSWKLKELPDFSMARNLEIMDLTDCTKLSAVHPSILSLHTLVSLNLLSCYQVKSLCSENHLKSLKHLSLQICFNLKEFLVSSEEMRILDLAPTRIEKLNLPIGRFNKLEELYLPWSLKSFQINELCCLTSLKKFWLSGFKEGIDKMKLHILFDGLCSVEELYLTYCEISEIPDNIRALSSLKILSLNGNSMENLPISIQHLSQLKKIDLSRCEKLRSLPELPPSITDFCFDECTSLETTEFSSTTFMLKHIDEERFSFSCRSCLGLGLDNRDIKEFVHFLLMRAIYNSGEVRVCYPGSIIPKWFKYTQTPNTPITIELAPASSDHLLGFICCVIFPPSGFKDDSSISRRSHFEDEEINDEFEEELLREVECDDSSIFWSFHFEDEEINEEFQEELFIEGEWDLREWDMDHVILRYAPLEHILKITGRRGYDEGTTSKLKCEIYANDWYNPFEPIGDVIKAWAICPVYASEVYKIAQQMELDLKKGTKRKRSHNFDDVFLNIVGSGVGCSFYENQGQQEFIHMMKQKHMRKMREL